MEIPKDISDRLIALGRTPDRIQNLVSTQGAEFVRIYVEKLEEADALYAHWSPRLREFEADCRARNVAPDIDTMSSRDRAKRAIYVDSIRRAEPSKSHGGRKVVFCCMPVVAIPIAKTLWPGDYDGAVFLTPEELGQWQALYSHPENSFWWFIHYWWDIQDPPKSPSLWSIDLQLLAKPEDPWLVISGHQWGDQAGGETADLWTWDGVEAKLTGNLGCCDF